MSHIHIQDSGPERATVADYMTILGSLGEFWGGRDVRHLHHPLFARELGDTSLVLRDPHGMIDAYLFGFVAPSRVAYVHVVGVRSSKRRGGLARELYDAFTRLALERDAVTLKAITTPTNTGSIAFHRSLGMTATEVADYAGEGQTRVVFRRQLLSEDETPR
jgi:ribosomal protein S18 acetylase RimI-like enzyme